MSAVSLSLRNNERLDAWVRQIFFLVTTSSNYKHKTELGESTAEARASAVAHRVRLQDGSMEIMAGSWPSRVQSAASLAHPAVDAGEAMAATTPIDAASRP